MNPRTTTRRPAAWISNVYRFDYILTDTEIEALSLENSLIKQYTPKYNIKLKDSKSYPYIKITLNDPYPKITVTRRRLADGAKYFGPYSSISALYSILGTVQKSFGIASCNRTFPRDIGKERPCLNHHLGICSAPCTGEISSEEYRALFREVIALSARLVQGVRAAAARAEWNTRPRI